jgi:hemerythrin-like domain-containing protein
MNASESMAALGTVEQDHRLVLDKVQALKEAIGFLVEPEGTDLRRALDRLKALERFFATQFAAHMEEEEQTLFPFLQRHDPDSSEVVAQLRREHADIRRQLEEFGNCLAVAGELEDELPRAVLRDLLADGWRLWEALDSHAHDETRAVHRCVGRALIGEAAPLPA